MNIRDAHELVFLPADGLPLRSQSPQPSSPSVERTDVVELGAPTTAAQDPVAIDILHMNDVHGQVDRFFDKADEAMVGGLPQAKTVIDQEKSTNPERTLVLNAGDIAEGSIEAYLTQGKVITSAFNAIGFDAVALGNHDFAWGQTCLQQMVGDLDAPVLGANVTRTDGGGLIHGIRPYILKELDGVKVAIIGLDTTETPRRMDPAKLEGVQFEDYPETLARYIPEVREQGADLVIVLSHLGSEEDKKLAAAVDGIDVIVGGHSHTTLPGGLKVGDTTIVQAGSQGKFVGKVHLEVDPGTKKVLSAEASLIPVSAEVPPDPGVASVIAPYLQEAEQKGAETVAQATDDLTHAAKEAAKLNQIYADAILDKSGADIAIASAKKLRADVPKGDVAFRDLFRVAPFAHEQVVTLRTTGQSVLTEIEERVQDGGRGLMVPAGFTYSYDPSLPSGQRVTSAVLDDGTALDPDKVYTVVLDDGTARKSHFAEAADLKVIGSYQDIFIDYFKRGSPWGNDPDNRVDRQE